jgi:hypothetical protein
MLTCLFGGEKIYIEDFIKKLPLRDLGREGKLLCPDPKCRCPVIFCDKVNSIAHILLIKKEKERIAILVVAKARSMRKENAIFSIFYAQFINQNRSCLKKRSIVDRKLMYC